MSHADRHDLRAYGLQCGTMDMIYQNVKQLGRDGLTDTQIRKAVKNLHPKVMLNLNVDRKGNITVMDRRMRWQRQMGWLSTWKKCRTCDLFLSPPDMIRGQCAGCVRYFAERARWAREAKQEIH